MERVTVNHTFDLSLLIPPRICLWKGRENTTQFFCVLNTALCSEAYLSGPTFKNLLLIENLINSGSVGC